MDRRSEIEMEIEDIPSVVEQEEGDGEGGDVGWKKVEVGAYDGFT